MSSSCIFCKIINNEIPSKRVYEDDTVIAIWDSAPQAPFHVLVMPREHFETVDRIPKCQESLFVALFAAVNTIVAQEHLSGQGYRLVINNGEQAGQSVPHLHIHILSGEKLSAKMG